MKHINYNSKQITLLNYWLKNQFSGGGGGYNGQV